MRLNACVLDLGLNSLQKRGGVGWERGVEGGGVESEPISSPRVNPLYRRLRGGSHPRLCVTRDGEPNTLPSELFLSGPVRTYVYIHACAYVCRSIFVCMGARSFVNETERQKISIILL